MRAGEAGQVDFPRSTVAQAVEAFRAGRMVIVVDDAARENEGDVMVAAERVTPGAINFMARHARGLICVALPPERLQALQLPPMVADNQTHHGTAFTVSVEAAHGVTTGISAADRARTIQVLMDPHSTPADLVRPGHVFPLAARPGGVLVRPGHTEAGVDLARMAGLRPGAVICEVMNDDGTMARLPDLVRFADRHGLPLITIADLAEYRLRTEQVVQPVAQAGLPTHYGDFRLHLFHDPTGDQQHVALVLGSWQPHEPVLVRVHSECLTGDVFGSQRCDCGEQLQQALAQMGALGRGVLLYMRQEGRGIGLANKIRAYALQETGLDTVEANEHLGFPADLRHYGIAAQILRAVGVRRVRLLTNNPAKIQALGRYGLEVVERVPLVVPPGRHNRHYLQTKRSKLGHLLGSQER
ncbi:3,4-dihydroxy-2-butanone 4-phosphate synthase [Litorilinea aerophila]|nr:3,4-dihydroxy-2-butanone 4-phosphate synthase [Litorilinea aerophila]